MKFIQRIAWYSGGFILGIIALMFFLNGKKASCAYGFDARTLKNIRSKKQIITPETLANLSKNGLDSTVISELLIHGDVLFTKNNRGLDSCKIYIIEGEASERSLKIYIENCKKTATVKRVVISTD